MAHIVILNEKAGPAGKDSDAVTVRELFLRAGVEVDLRPIAPEDVMDALRAAADARPTALFVGGGDGTVRCAAAVLAGTGIPLGVLPLGTFNHFAKDLGIPPKLEDAIAALAEGEVRAVDLGEVNGHVFINNCSLGGYAEAVRRRDALRANGLTSKLRAMLRASWQTFWHLRRLRLRVAVEGQAPREVRTPLVFVGNNRYDGAVLRHHLRARLDEGRLWLYVMRVHRQFAVLRLILRSLFWRLDSAEALDTEAATEFVIESGGGLVPAAVDGEIIDLKSPMRFRIRARVLQVLVPARGPAKGNGP